MATDPEDVRDEEIDELDAGTGDDGYDDGIDDQGDGDGDEHSPDADHAEVGGDGEPGRAEEVKPKSRGQLRVEAALREAREAKAEAAAARAEAAANRSQGNAEAEAARERAALAEMEPYERIEYQLQKTQRQQDQRFAQLEANTRDADDRAAFLARCASTPALAAIAAEVEDTIKSARANGTYVPRETAAMYLLGQKVLAKGGAARTRQVNKAASGVARERARPTGGSSDVPARSGRNEAADRRKRLEDAQI